jgi:hypothetical protein
MKTKNTVVQTAEYKAGIAVAKKMFVGKSKGFAVGYLTALRNNLKQTVVPANYHEAKGHTPQFVFGYKTASRHLAVPGHVLTAEKYTMIRNAAFACGLLEFIKDINPLMETKKTA